jgi:hypothetical protein
MTIEDAGAANDLLVQFSESGFISLWMWFAGVILNYTFKIMSANLEEARHMMFCAAYGIAGADDIILK